MILFTRVGFRPVWVGGDRAIFDRHLATLQAIGKAIRHVGPIGSGTVTKLMHNVLGYTIMLAEAEVFSVAVKAGLDPLELWEALRLGFVGKRSPLDMLTSQFLPGTYDKPAFALKLGTKDATLATELARDLGVAMRLSTLTQAEMSACGDAFILELSRLAHSGKRGARAIRRCVRWSCIPA